MNFVKVTPFFIFLLALLLRIWWLGIFPVGITNDEADYVLNAKAIFMTGKDVSGSWSPLSLTAKSIGTKTAELPSLLFSPFIGPFNLSLFTARLPYALISSLTVLLLYLIVKNLINNQVALIAGLLLAINPWSIHFGRTAFESPVALFFYLMAFYLILKNINWKVLYALPFLFLGFFSYHGTKIIFLPLVIILLTFNYLKNLKKIKITPYLILLISCLAIFGYFIFSLKSQSIGGRTTEFIFILDGDSLRMINEERRLSIQNSLNNIFSNKFIYVFKTFFSKYLQVFSPNLLFLTGESRGAYSLWFHGLFYYLDFIFLLLGFGVLFCYKRNVWYLLISLCLIAPLPSALSRMEDSYVLRSALLFPIFVIFIAQGIVFFIRIFSKKELLVGSLLAGFYCLSLIFFLHLYFFRYPVYGSEGFFLSERLLSEYAKRTQIKDREIIVVNADPLSTFQQYLFYSGIYNQKNTALAIAEKIKNNDYSYGKVKFIDSCPDEDYFKDSAKTIIVNSVFECNPGVNSINIANLGDSGTIFRIYNDQLCQNLELKKYLADFSINNFLVDKNTDAVFCQNWFTVD